MLFDFTLDELLNFATIAIVIIAVINVIVISDSQTRYYLVDKNGESSKSVFTRGTIHNNHEKFQLYKRLFLNGIIGGLAAIAIAAIVTGTVRSSLGEIDKGGVIHVLFIWFTFMQIKRITIEHYILKTMMKIKPRVVKIDGNQHYISTVNELPWFVSNSTVVSVITLVSSIIFVNLF